jgi:hypothetical protein
MGNESSADSSDEGIPNEVRMPGGIMVFSSHGESTRLSRRPRERLKISVDLENVYPKEVNMSALEEGLLNVNSEIMAMKPIFIPRCQMDLTDISTLVKKNSFEAVNEKDAECLLLENEIIDLVGDFPYFCDVSDVSAFEELFRFVAEYNFQIVSIDREKTAIISIFVIRPIPVNK